MKEDEPHNEVGEEVGEKIGRVLYQIREKAEQIDALMNEALAILEGPEKDSTQ